MKRKSNILSVVVALLSGLCLFAYADELPPSLQQAIIDPDIPMIVDATIIEYTKEGYAKIKVNTVYKKGYTKDYKPRNTVSIRNPIEELRSDIVRIPAIVRGYGYEMGGGGTIAKMNVIHPSRENKRFLFFLSGDLLYGTYSNVFAIQEQKDGSLSVETGRGWKPLADIVRAIPTANR